MHVVCVWRGGGGGGGGVSTRGDSCRRGVFFVFGADVITQTHLQSRLDTSPIELLHPELHHDVDEVSALSNLKLDEPVVADITLDGLDGVRGFNAVEDLADLGLGRVGRDLAEDNRGALKRGLL